MIPHPGIKGVDLDHYFSALLGRLEELTDCHDTPVIGVTFRQLELGQNAPDMLFNRALGHEESTCDPSIRSAL
ncbi:MAG TPA: hypothetical protein VMD59_03915, partial [Acidimicrobiales bacterium]|nr:hypothetical protein [Acidimicrobiales bacterium]